MNTSDVVELIGISAFTCGVGVPVLYGTGLFPVWAATSILLTIVGLFCIGVANRGGAR